MEEYEVAKNNETLNYYYEYETEEVYETTQENDRNNSDNALEWFLISIFSVLFIIGAVLNLIVIVVQTVNKKWKTYLNVLVLNLAVADLIFVVFSYTVILGGIVKYPWVFGDVPCKLLNYILVSSFGVTMYTLVLLSLDCFVAIVFPFLSLRIRTVRKVTILVIVVWLVMFLVFVPYALKFRIIIDEKYSTDLVTILNCRQLDQSLSVEIFVFVVTFVVPLLLMFGLYFTMAISVWRRPALQSSNSSDQLTRARRKKVTIRVTILIGTFVVFVGPTQVTALIDDICTLKQICWTDDLLTKLVVFATSYILLFTHSCLNPVVYSFLLPGFRKTILKTCGYKRKLTPLRVSYEMTALSSNKSA